MRLSSFFSLLIKAGRTADPRRYKSHIHEYADSAILYGKAQTSIKKLLVGIDIDVAELLLAAQIRQKEGLDLVLSHHPQGGAYANLPAVMDLQVQILTELGIGESAANGFIDERKREVQRKIMPQNHSRAVSAAVLLGMPFVCCHTPADNNAFGYIQLLLSKEKPKLLNDIIDILMVEPEYKQSSKIHAGPKILVGNPKRQAGKILVEMTGGAEGHKDIYKSLYKKGIRTLVSMHLSEDHLKTVCDANLNAVIAGHIASDALGLNLILDAVEKEESLEILECSGFHRYRRIKISK
jgi:putative NIF3 family GTP cyclohydrolase 1 type 2